jgi:membrane fusion protein (multidrug efflux system)
LRLIEHVREVWSMLRWLWIPMLLLAASEPVRADEAAAAPTEPGATWVATRRIAPGPYELTLPPKVGLLDAAERRSLSFQVQGRLEILAEEGTELAEGEAIARLDAELQQVQVRQAEIRLAEAVSEANRVRGLRRSDAASAKLLETAETAVALRRADLAAAREELARRTLHAPFAGVVAETLYELDEVVAPGSPVAVFLQRASLEIEVGVPGYQVARVAPGARVHVAVPALGDARFEGVVDRVAPATTEGGALFAVTILVPNAEGSMRPGMIARVRIVTDALPSAVVTPLSVAVERAGRRSVFFVVEGHARAVDASDAALDGDRLVLIGDVPSHELIVRGQRDLRDGTRVRVSDAVLAGSSEPSEPLRPEVRGPRP